MSVSDFTAEEYMVLSWLISNVKNLKTHLSLVDVDLNSGVVKLIHDSPPNFEVDKIFTILSGLEKKGLVSGVFDKKVARCVACGKTVFQPHLNCPSCNSENVEKAVIYVHSCGANITEHLLKSLVACPKCGESINPKNFVAEQARFVCNDCGSVFEKPDTSAQCISCGTVKKVSELNYITYKKYVPTEKGSLLVESKSPSRILMKKLLDEGFKVSEKVVLKGISGATHVVDMLAITLAETRVYDVKFYADSEELLRFAVKRFDVEKTTIPGALGRVRWLMAAVEFEESCRRTAETFGIEIEEIKIG